MFRCLTLAAATLCLHLPALAQVQRPFPATALRGELVIQAPPQVLLNGAEARLSPGARIRGQDNMLQMSASLVGQKLRVHYTLETLGLIHEVWILRPEEAALRPWPRTAEEARSWRFDPVAQTWSKP